MYAAQAALTYTDPTRFLSFAARGTEMLSSQILVGKHNRLSKLSAKLTCRALFRLRGSRSLACRKTHDHRLKQF